MAKQFLPPKSQNPIPKLETNPYACYIGEDIQRGYITTQDHAVCNWDTYYDAKPSGTKVSALATLTVHSQQSIQLLGSTDVTMSFKISTAGKW